MNGWTITDFDAEKLGLSNDLLTIGEGQTGEINQTLLGMPNGVYELSVQAFQRADWNFEKMDSLWSIGKGDSLISTVSSYIFLNDGEHKIKHSFQDAFTGDEFTASWDIRQGTKSGVMMPNTESGARQYFDKGYFKNTVQAFVIDGKLTFGIRNYGDQFARWGCYDNFTLTYVGKDLEKVIALLEQWLEKVETYLGEKMNGAIKKQMTEAYNRGTELVNDPEADFDECIDVIATLTEAIGNVDESIESFKLLAHANEVAAKDLAYEGVAATESGQQLQAL